MQKYLLYPALLFLAATSLRSQVPFYDAMDYPNGNITTNSGGLWLRHSGGSGDSLEVNHRYEVNEGRQDDIHRWFNPSTTNGYSGGLLYASFLMKMTNLPSNGGGAYLAHFMDTGTEFRGRLFVLTNGALPGAYRVGVANAAADFSAGTGGPNQVLPMDLALNTDYQVVLKYDIDFADAMVWINPASENDLAAGPTGDFGSVTNPLAAFAFRQSAGEGVSEIAKLQVGFNFADVATNAAAIPVIGLQPLGVTNYSGNPMTLTVLASGQSLSYQWIKDGSALSGATLNQYAVSQLQASHQGNYYCVVSNTAGSTNSATVFVSVNTTLTAPTFTLPLANATNAVGQTARFNASVVGTGPLNFQWYLNNSQLFDGPTGSGSALSGTTTPSLTIATLSAADAGTYTLTVTGGAGTTSSNALLVVLPPAVPISAGNYSQNFDSLASSGTANAWTDGATLTGWYASQAGGSATAGPVTTYRADSGTSTAGAIYSYGVAGVNPATDRALGSIGSGTPGNLAYGVLFTNDTEQIATNFTIAYTGEQWRNGGNASVQTLAFSYRVSSTPITTSDAANTLTWTALPALNFNTPITGLTATALDGNASANRTVIPAVVLTNVIVLPGEELFLRWYDINDAGFDHALAVDDLTVTFTTFSPPATAPKFTVQPQSRTNNANSTAIFSATVSGGLPMTLQWLKNSGPVSDGPTGSGSTISGSTSPTLVINNVFASDAGDYVLSASNSESPTPTNSATAHLTVIDPVITAQPASVTDVVGDNANFFVGAAGTPALAYQWLSNGVAIPGATANALNLPTTPSASLAAYSAIVSSGSGGSVTSAVANIILVPTPSTNIARWDFNSTVPDANVATGTTAPAVGSGTLSLLSSNSVTFAAGCFADPADVGTDNSGWNTTSYPAPGTGNKTGGIQFSLSTVGFKNLMLIWQQRNSATASKYGRVQYSTDGANFTDFTVITMLNTNQGFQFCKSDLSSIVGVNNNPNSAFRIVTEFQSTAVGGALADYVPTSPGNYGTGGTIRFDWLNLFADPTSLVTPIPISAQLVGTNLVLSWNGSGFNLQAAPEVTGTYTNIPSATSPYSYPVTGLRKFFRLKSNP